MKPNMQGKQSKSSEIWNEIIKRVLTHGPTRLESAHLMIHGRQVVEKVQLSTYVFAFLSN
jgi:hypothetical protein